MTWVGRATVAIFTVIGAYSIHPWFCWGILTGLVIAGVIALLAVSRFNLHL